MGKRKIQKYNEKLKAKQEEVDAKEYELAKISKDIANLSDDEVEKSYELKIEYDAVSAELDRLKDNLEELENNPPKDRQYEKIDKKDEKIDDLHRILSELEYQREDCLQHLNQLKMEEQELMQVLENAKIERDVNAIIDARENLLKVRAEIAKVDERLNKIIANITMKSIKKAELQETVIAEYEKYARKNDIEEIVMNVKINSAKSIYKEQDETRRERQQKKYRKDNFLKEDSKKDQTPPKKEDSKKDPIPPKKEDPKKDPTPPKKEDSKKDQNPMPRELDDKRREELEKESIERYEAKQSSKKRVRFRRFIGKIWKKITSLLALGTNKLGRAANKRLLAAGDSLQNKLKNDEDIYEKRVDKFRQGYRSTLSQEKQEEIARKELEKVNSNKQNQEHKNSNEDQQQE